MRNKLLTVTLLLAMSLAVTVNPVLADGQVNWEGQGSDNLPCVGGGHWVLAPAFGVSSATLTVNGESYVMSQNGQGSWAADSVGPLDVGLTAYVTYTGAGDERNHLQLSHCTGTPATATPTATTPPTQYAAFAVVVGQCVWRDNASWLPINLTLDHAIFSIGAWSTNVSGGWNLSEPNEYDWTATADAGYVFPAGTATSGHLAAVSCPPPATPTDTPEPSVTPTNTPGPSVTPTMPGQQFAGLTLGGSCVWHDGASWLKVEWTVSNATFTMADISYNYSGSVELPEPQGYNWLATPYEGFVFPPGIETHGYVGPVTCSPTSTSTPPSSTATPGTTPSATPGSTPTPWLTLTPPGEGCVHHGPDATYQIVVFGEPHQQVKLVFSNGAYNNAELDDAGQFVTSLPADGVYAVSVTDVQTWDGQPLQWTTDDSIKPAHASPCLVRKIYLQNPGPTETPQPGVDTGFGGGGSGDDGSGGFWLLLGLGVAALIGFAFTHRPTTH